MALKHRTVTEYKKRVCTAMNFISDNLIKNISIEEIAQHASFSPFHFHRIFKAVVGETISEFTRRLRLELAANRLIQLPHKDITEIALDSGFSSSQNFAKAFRKHFNLSPSEFIRKNGNKISKHEKALSLKVCYTDPVFNKLLNSERKILMNAEIKELPDYYVAYVRKLGAYEKESCQQAFEELTTWAGPKGYLMSGEVLGVYWDNPEITPPEKCRIDACVTISKDTIIAANASINTQTLFGGSYAICSFEVTEDGFKEAWNEAFIWLIQNGYECADKPCYELYHNDPKDHPENKFSLDICIPLK